MEYNGSIAYLYLTSMDTVNDMHCISPELTKCRPVQMAVVWQLLHLRWLAKLQTMGR